MPKVSPRGFFGSSLVFARFEDTIMTPQENVIAEEFSEKLGKI